MNVPRSVALLHLAVGLSLCRAAAERPSMLPATTPPIVYTINYSGDYFTRPDYLEPFRAAPPDLLHVGKAVPIIHHWGPIRLYQGENQYTGGPGHTLSRENIALLSPAALAKRIDTIRETLRRVHAIGIREIAPYISYHTLAGDHDKRKGFWGFYDKWTTYAKWAGPKPESDPFDWLVVDRAGKFVGGSCGGYSPAYYAPLHRYRACINHPDWAEWHRRLVRMVAEVGYDGCFVDNAHPDPCFCRHCTRLFRQFLDDRRGLPWVQRLTQGVDAAKLALGSSDAPRELIRRWRLTRTRDHLGMLREVGRKVKPGFTIFPNSGRIDDCLLVGARCDRLMFESTFSPGILTAGEPPETDAVTIDVSAEPTRPEPVTYRYELRDGITWMEMQADLSFPTRLRVGRPAALTVTIATLGASLRDGDAAEGFHLVLRDTRSGEEVRLDLEPRGPVGGSGSSLKPRQPPATLKAVWTPTRAGSYAVHFGFRYTDDSHAADTRNRAHLDRLTHGLVCRTHMPELLFTQHMAARAIYLGYEAARKGWENVQELALAEMAAFSGGGGFSGKGAPQAKYRAFFKAHPTLFDGWTPTAPAAVLYAHWGHNPFGVQRPNTRPTIHRLLAETHRLLVPLVDRTVGADLTGFRVIYLGSMAYELTPAQLDALRAFFRGGGSVVLADPAVTINGQAAAGLLTRTLIVATAAAPGQRAIRRGPPIWDWKVAARMVAPAPAQRVTPLERAAWSAMIRTAPIAPSDGRRRNLRFALYRRGESLALHVVNYNVCLLHKSKRVLDVGPTPVHLPIPAGWTAAEATCYSPDAPPKTLPCTLGKEEHDARLALPPTHIYQIVLLRKR